MDAHLCKVTQYPDGCHPAEQMASKAPATLRPTLGSLPTRISKNREADLLSLKVDRHVWWQMCLGRRSQAPRPQQDAAASAAPPLPEGASPKERSQNPGLSQTKRTGPQDQACRAAGPSNSTPLSAHRQAPTPARVRSTVIQRLPGTSAKQDAGSHPTSPSPCRPLFLRVGRSQASWISCCSWGPGGDEMGDRFRTEPGAPAVRQGPQLAPPASPHSPEPPPCLALAFQTEPGHQALLVPEGSPRSPFLSQELCVHTRTPVLSAKTCPPPVGSVPVH